MLVLYERYAYCATVSACCVLQAKSLMHMHSQWSRPSGKAVSVYGIYCCHPGHAALHCSLRGDCLCNTVFCCSCSTAAAKLLLTLCFCCFRC